MKCYFLYSERKKPLNWIIDDLMEKNARVLDWSVALSFLNIFIQIQDRITVANWRVLNEKSSTTLNSAPSKKVKHEH